MLKIPIKNVSAKILVIWQRGKKETAETFEYETSYVDYNGEELFFEVGEDADRLSQFGQIHYEYCPAHLDFEIIYHPVVGFVELKNS